MGSFPMLKVYFKYTVKREPIVRGLQRISRPGCRVYTKKDEIPGCSLLGYGDSVDLSRHCLGAKRRDSRRWW
jgi:ribosomal protein S8